MQQNQKINRRILFWMLFSVLAASWSISTTIAGAKSGVPGNTPASKAGTETLKAEDKGGLPLPANYTDYSGEESPYLHKITAVSPSPLKTVLEFYRRELDSRKWRNLTGPTGAVVDKAVLTFENAKKDRLVLKLTRNADGKTEISVAVKSEGAAKKDGILPLPGKARIYLGNMTDGQVVFDINQKKFIIKKQSVNDNSMKNAPFVDVPPGKYPFTLSMPDQAPVKDAIEVGPDETWGLIAGPGGALPLQMY